MYREKLYNRAILIAMCRRDDSKCIEEFSLYNSTVKLLVCMDSDSDFELDLGMEAQAKMSPFSLKQLKDAYYEAKELARKELRDGSPS